MINCVLMKGDILRCLREGRMEIDGGNDCRGGDGGRKQLVASWLKDWRTYVQRRRGMEFKPHWWWCPITHVKRLFFFSATTYLSFLLLTEEGT